MAWVNLSPLRFVQSFKTKKNKQTASALMNAAGVEQLDSTKFKIDDSFMNGEFIAMPNFNARRNGLSNIVIKTGSATVNKIINAYRNKPNIGNYQNGQYVEIKFAQNYNFKGGKLPQVVKFVQTSKLNVNAAGVKVSAAAMTAMSELGVLWVMRQAIQRNKNFNSADDIKKDKETWNELVNIWTLIGKMPDGPDDSWLDTFYQSNRAFLRVISSPSFTEFNRGKYHANNSTYTIPGSDSSDSFMEYISDFVNQNYGISKKDNWNPADIWLIKNKDKWKRQIEASCKYDGPKSSASAMVNLEQLNSILRNAYNSHEIIGVSLKKITKGQEMIYVAVNTTEKFISDRSDTEFKKQYAFSGAHSYFDEAKDGPITQDTVIWCANDKVSFQVKANSSSDKSGSGLKYEGTERPRTGARLGKATVSLVVDLMRSYGLDFDTNKTSYPFSPEEFASKKDDYVKKLKYLASKGVTLYKTTRLTPEQAADRLEYTFQVQPWVANSKCQQITWLDKVMHLSPDDLNNFLADMLFLSKKEGKGYGPFGKIY
jgi:hypothetical protein